MLRADRFAAIFFLTIGALAAGGLWAWFLYAQSFLLLAAALVVTLWPALLWQFLRADLEAERGRAAQEWAAAGYRYTTLKGRVWIDADGDGEVDAGELQESFPIYDKEHPKTGGDPAAAEAEAQQLRALLIWCYRRQEAGEDFDQKPGRKQFKGFYDGGMQELARRGFLRARSTGHRGDLVLATLSEALEDFDDA